MDAERSDGGEGGGEPEVVDEFACAGMLRGSLTSLHSAVERIFSVIFDIGVADLTHDNNGQIWLKLQGRSNSVKAAKASHHFLVFSFVLNVNQFVKILLRSDAAFQENDSSKVFFKC